MIFIVSFVFLMAIVITGDILLGVHYSEKGSNQISDSYQNIEWLRYNLDHLNFPMSGFYLLYLMGFKKKTAKEIMSK